MIKRNVAIGAVMLLSIAIACTAWSNESLRRHPSPVIRFASVTSVSQRFQDETEAATQTIPKHVWRIIKDAGWHIQLAEFVVDAAPSLRGVHPRGWPTNLTWENSDALHLPRSKLLVVAEKRRNSHGKVVRSSRVANVLRHELGHAFDMAVGDGNRVLSSTSRFVAAYNHDAGKLAPTARKRFAYYLQGSRAGWQETFAEAFAVVLGGGSSEFADGEFEAAFPQAVAFARQAIATPPTLRPQVQAVSQPATRTLFRRR